MRIAESFCKMRLSEYCSAQDIDRAIAVTVESFIGSQKVSAKKALSRAFAKYVIMIESILPTQVLIILGTHLPVLSLNPGVVPALLWLTHICLALLLLRGRWCLMGWCLCFFASSIPYCLHAVCRRLQFRIRAYEINVQYDEASICVSLILVDL